MHKYQITLYWSDEDRAFVAEVPELPGCMAHGDTREAPTSRTFWESSTLAELARVQNVKPMTDVQPMFGTWPGQENDGFEAAIDELRHPGKELNTRPSGQAERRQAMGRDETLTLLRAHKAVLVQRFGVVDIALFGSTVRDEATSDSDVDILVHFDGPATSKRYFGVQFYLEDLTGLSVDLVTDKALRPELRPYVEREAIYV